MIKMSELQQGDLVIAEYEGIKWEGIVTELNHEDKEVCVQTEVQSFWYTPEHLYPIPVDGEHLKKLGFEKEEGDEYMKFKKGAFRIKVPKGGDFADLEMWYREDRRHMRHLMAVHELQNQYYQMTKVELNQD
jgi:hypothetical protein